MLAIQPPQSGRESRQYRPVASKNPHLSSLRGVTPHTNSLLPNNERATLQAKIIDKRETLEEDSFDNADRAKASFQKNSTDPHRVDHGHGGGQKLPGNLAFIRFRSCSE